MLYTTVYVNVRRNHPPPCKQDQDVDNKHFECQHYQEAGAVEEEMSSDLLIWTAGSQPSSIVASLDAQKDSKGRIEVDQCLQLIEAESEADSGREVALPVSAGVYCVGDIAAVRGRDLPCNAQVHGHIVGTRSNDMFLEAINVSSATRQYTVLLSSLSRIAPVPRWLCSSRITLLTIYGRRKNDVDRFLLGTDLCIRCSTFHCFLV